MIPASLRDRFSSSGKTNVISMGLGTPSVETQTVSVAMPKASWAEPILADQDVDQMRPVETQDLRSRRLIDRRIETIADEKLPDLVPAEVLVKLPVESLQPKLKRREHVLVDRHAESDAKSLRVPVRQRRATIQILLPPTNLAKQVEQIVGVEQKSAADFSKNLPPGYPAIAVRGNLEGVVTLRLDVSDHGDVWRVEVVESSGHTVLDQAAMTAVGKWKGQPATQWGRPIASTEVLPIRFKL